METIVAVNDRETFTFVDDAQDETFMRFPDGRVIPQPSTQEEVLAFGWNGEELGRVIAGFKLHVQRRAEEDEAKAEALKALIAEIEAGGFATLGEWAAAQGIAPTPPWVEEYQQKEWSDWAENGWIELEANGFSVTAAGQAAIVSGEMPNPDHETDETLLTRARVAACLANPARERVIAALAERVPEINWEDNGDEILAEIVGDWPAHEIDDLLAEAEERWHRNYEEQEALSDARSERCTEALIAMGWLLPRDSEGHRYFTEAGEVALENGEYEKFCLSFERPFPPATS